MTPKETKYATQLDKLKNTVERAIIDHEVLKRTLMLEEPEEPGRRAGLMMHRLREQKATLVNDMASILAEIMKIDL